MNETTTTAPSGRAATEDDVLAQLRAALLARLDAVARPGGAQSGPRQTAQEAALLAPADLEVRGWPPLAHDGGASSGAAAAPAPRVSVRVSPSEVTIAVTAGLPGPCPGCLDLRWLHARPMAERDVLEAGRALLQTPHAPSESAALTVLAGLVRAAATVPLTTAPGRAPVWSYTRRTGEIHRYSLMRSSDCPRCHEQVEDTAERARVTVESLPVVQGSGRSRTPESLALPLDALANPVCGALGGPAMRAYQATATAPTTGRFTVRSKYGLHDMWWSGHADSYARSELLGALEGLERSAGQYNRRAPALWARAKDLGVPFVDPEDCGTYSEEFYAGHDRQYLPWSSEPVVPWVWGWSLTEDRAVLVPEQLVYYLDRRPEERRTVQECSNGCASGSSLTEAVLHGLLELLERDAFLLSWYTAEPLRRIDLGTVPSPMVAHMRGRVELLGYDLRCFDIRVDVPVPAVGAVAVRRDGGLGMLCFAAGASCDPAGAVEAAVCETASYVPGFEDRVRSELPGLRAMVQDHRLVTRLEHHALLFGLPEMAHHAARWTENDRPSQPLGVVFADWDRMHEATADLGAVVRRIVRLLAERGFDTVVVDQTTPEQRSIGIRTASVIVPGLIPIDFGWERQRVLTMPRARYARRPDDNRSTPRDTGALLRVPHPFP